MGDALIECQSPSTPPSFDVHCGFAILKKDDSNCRMVTSLLSRITMDPEICHGKPCIHGKRYPVESMLEYLAGGDTTDDLPREFPDLERDDVLACLEFARAALTARSVHLTLP